MKLQFFTNKILVLSLFFAIAMASVEVPLWISVFTFVIISWRFAFEKWNTYKMPVNWTPVLGVMIFIVVFIQYRSLFGQEPSTTALLGLISITILNYSSQRDHYFIVMQGFLLIAFKFIFSIDLVWVVPAVISFFGLWASLLNNVKTPKAKLLFSLSLKSLPLLIVLMIFFPRFVVFQTQRIENRLNRSGFSESLNPGRIAELALENSVVFRADFNQLNMNSEDLYWRGAILTDSDGLIWTKSSIKQTVSNPPESSYSATIKYSVVLDTLDLKNVFVLETPVKIVSSTQPILQQPNHLYALPVTITQELQFEAEASNTREALDEQDSNDLERYLAHPELPPKSLLLVNDIKANNPDPAQRIKALNNFFSRTNFTYTLKPDYYKNDLDEFLFLRKKGFCEHFAAAYGTLARALGIPTRIVLGYQGGAYNSVGGFWVISQKDAHAWVELALDGRWERVDPTGFVSPLRLSLGGEGFFSLSEEEQYLQSKNINYRKDISIVDFVFQLQLLFESLNYKWSLFLLNYDLQAQISLFNQLKGNWYVGTLFILLIALYIFLTRKKKKSTLVYQNEFSQLIFEIETWAQSQGLKIAPNQTPLESLKQIAKKYPASAQTLESIANEYTNLVYRKDKTSTVIKTLKNQWHQFVRAQQATR